MKQREHLWLKMQKEVKKNTNFRLAIYECENYEDAEKAINSKNLISNGITKLKEKGN